MWWAIIILAILLLGHMHDTDKEIKELKKKLKQHIDGGW